MEGKNNVQMVPLASGEEFKALAVKGEKDAKMPLHKATGEAVVIVRQGAIELNIDQDKKRLNKDDTHIIPAGILHSVKVIEDFEATVLMNVKTEIAFE